MSAIWHDSEDIECTDCGRHFCEAVDFARHECEPNPVSGELMPGGDA